MIISNVFKSFLRNQIIDPPKWWYHTIEEVANAPSNYPIYMPINSIAYYTIKQKAKDNSNFRKLLDRIKLVSVKEMFGNKIEKQFYGGECGSFMTSKVHEHHEIMIPNEIVTKEIRYNRILDVRSIRKDFQFSDQIVKL